MSNRLHNDTVIGNEYYLSAACIIHTAGVIDKHKSLALIPTSTQLSASKNAGGDVVGITESKFKRVILTAYTV